MKNKEQKISEILNLIGYGLAKFNLDFVYKFGLNTKSAFYNYIVDIGIAKTIKVVSNRQDSFDPYFDNGRKGWWQRKQREHIKLFIDSLFGNENAQEYANIVKMFIKNFDEKVLLDKNKIAPIVESKFKQLQLTGKEAEFYFINHYNFISEFANGIIEDARLWGDGYDFQIKIDNNFLLVEVKGVRGEKGSIRFTNNEFEKSKKFSDLYFLAIVSNLENIPKISVVNNPTKNLDFSRKEIISTQINYNTKFLTW